ncbi:MAG: aminotransferase class I/II-fold pyridoxal phosphate-dependent enzyme [Deltaproteobacteria bacterium]|nr:aminotransferase class I/II-fold pyridoxal phosphate-dependent enzyme [Deltaproteobacteria bacterium]
MTMDAIKPARRTERIQYAVRDVVLVARQAKAAGRELLYLNIGDPNQFDFVTPPHIVDAICRAMRDNHTGYAPSEGLPVALEAIRAQAARNGIRAVRDAFVGNGGSECIEICLSALADEGDDVLLPWPGYPLYSAVLNKLGVVENPYFLDESNGWQPDPADLEARLTPRTRALVIINPNNPTGSVCERRTLEALVEFAARHKLVILCDEIYDRLVLDDRLPHVSLASLTDEVPVLTFNGMSKAFLGPGLRMGWCVVSGPEQRVRPLVDAIHKFLRARLCANLPVQYGIVPALEGDQSHVATVVAKLRARRQITVEMLNAIPGVSCVAPAGAFYAFPRLEIEEPDEAWVKRLILETGVVVVHGSGFGQRPGTAHFRVVFLPPEETLRRAFAAIGDFMQQSRIARVS